MAATATAIRAGRAFVELFADDTKLQAVLTRTRVGLNNLGGWVRSVGIKMLALGPAISLPIAASLKRYAEFELQMKKVQAVTGAVGPEFRKLAAEARRLGRETVFTSAEAAAAMFVLSKQGYRTAKDITAIVGPALDLAAAAEMDLAEAVRITTGILKSQKFPVDQPLKLKHAIDMLTEAFHSSNMADITELGDALKYVGPVTEQLKVPLDQVTAAIQALSDANIRGEMAGTTLRGALLSLISPSEKAAKSLAQLRIVGPGFNKLVDKATGGLRPFHDVIGEFEGSFKRMGLSALQQQAILAKIFDDRQASGFARLVSVGGVELARMAGHLRGATGRAEQLRQVKFEALKGQFEILTGAIDELAIAIGEHLAPAASELLKWGTKATETLSKFAAVNGHLVLEVTKGAVAITATGAALFTIGSAAKLAAFSLGGIGIAIRTAVSPARLLSDSLTGVLRLMAKGGKLGRSWTGFLTQSVLGGGRGPTRPKAAPRKHKAPPDPQWQALKASLGKSGGALGGMWTEHRDSKSAAKEAADKSRQKSSQIADRAAKAAARVASATRRKADREARREGYHGLRITAGMSSAGKAVHSSRMIAGMSAAAMPVPSVVPILNWWQRLKQSAQKIGTSIRPSDFSRPLTTKGFDHVVDAMANFEAAAGRSFVAGVGVLGKKQRTTGLGQTVRGLFSRRKKKVRLNPEAATVESGMHELGHAVDWALGGGRKGKKKLGYASESGKGLIGSLMSGLTAQYQPQHHAQLDQHRGEREARRASELAKRRTMANWARERLATLLPDIERTPRGSAKHRLLVGRKRELRQTIAENEAPYTFKPTKSDRLKKQSIDTLASPRELFARFFAKQTLPVQVALAQKSGPGLWRQLQTTMNAAGRRITLKGYRIGRRLGVIPDQGQRSRPLSVRSGPQTVWSKAAKAISNTVGLLRDAISTRALRLEAYLLGKTLAATNLVKRGWNSTLRAGSAVADVWRMSYARAMQGMAKSRVVIGGVRALLFKFGPATGIMNAGFKGLAGTWATVKTAGIGLGLGLKGAWWAAGAGLSALKTGAMSLGPILKRGFTAGMSAAWSLAKSLPAISAGMAKVAWHSLQATGAVLKFAAAKGFAGIVGGLTALLSPMGLVTAGLAVGATLLVRNWSAVSGAISGAAMSMPSKLRAAWSRIKDDSYHTFETMKRTGLAAFNGITEAVQAGDLPAAMTIAWEGIKAIWSQGTSYLALKWLDVKEATLNVWDDLLGFTATAAVGVMNAADTGLFLAFGVRLDDITAWASNAWTAIGATAVIAFNWLGTTWDSLMNRMAAGGTSWSDLWLNTVKFVSKGAAMIFGGMWKGMMGMVREGLKMMVAAASPFMSKEKTQKMNLALDRTFADIDIDGMLQGIEKDIEGRRAKAKPLIAGDDPKQKERGAAAEARIAEIEAQRVERNAALALEKAQQAQAQKEVLFNAEKELKAAISNTKEARKAREEAEKKGQLDRENAASQQSNKVGPKMMPEGLNRGQQRKWQIQQQVAARKQMFADKKDRDAGLAAKQKLAQMEAAASKDYTREFHAGRLSKEDLEFVTGKKAPAMKAEMKPGVQKELTPEEAEKQAATRAAAQAKIDAAKTRAAEKEAGIKSRMEAAKAKAGALPDLEARSLQIKARIPDLAGLVGRAKTGSAATQDKLAESLVTGRIDMTNRKLDQVVAGLDKLRLLYTA